MNIYVYVSITLTTYMQNTNNTFQIKNKTLNKKNITLTSDISHFLQLSVQW